MAETKKTQMLDTAVSTRIRLARNLANYPFPHRMTAEQKEAVVREVTDALFSANKTIGQTFHATKIADMPQAEALYLVEQHLISPEFAETPDGVVLRDDSGTVSIMLNEEDHIRIQVVLPGAALDEAMETANRIDDLLDEKLRYAFDERLGYLTQCPTNLGTGLRASVMVHLPVLTDQRAIGSLSAALSKLGMTVRGIYGEGSEARGKMYQISNQVTLGLSEQEAVESLKTVVAQVMEQEAQAREKVFAASPAAFDRVCRALGTLQYARLLSGEEFMELVSDVRMGLCAGALEGMTPGDVDQLIAQAQPATILHRLGRNLSAQERDRERADFVRAAVRSVQPAE